MPEQSGPTICPRCGQSNDCAIAAGETDTPCWCLSTEFKPGALAGLSETDKGRCICPRCAATDATTIGDTPLAR